MATALQGKHVPRQHVRDAVSVLAAKWRPQFIQEAKERGWDPINRTDKPNVNIFNFTPPLDDSGIGWDPTHFNGDETSPVQEEEFCTPSERHTSDGNVLDHRPYDSAVEAEVLASLSRLTGVDTTTNTEDIWPTYQCIRGITSQFKRSVVIQPTACAALHMIVCWLLANLEHHQKFIADAEEDAREVDGMIEQVVAEHLTEEMDVCCEELDKADEMDAQLWAAVEDECTHMLE